LQAINEACNFVGSAITLRSLPRGENVLSIAAGDEERWLGSCQSHVSHIIQMWGGASRLERFPVGEPLLLSQVPDLPHARQTTCHKEWVQPQGIDDAVAICLERNATSLVTVAFSRTKAAGPIDNVEMETLRILAPHLRRSFKIGRVLDVNAAKAEPAVALLDKVTVGVVFIDEQLGIVGANNAASDMMSKGDPFIVKKNKLAVRERGENARFQKALTLTVRDELGPAHRGIGVSICRCAGHRCVLNILPLGNGEIRPLMRRSARAAILISPEANVPLSSDEAIAQVYDLTASERRIFSAIAVGKTPFEIAEELGVAQSTVKFHLHNVFSKTGAARQSDLVRLAGALSLG
jgi:DNA-binding CsgD family transcriptional regulator